MTPSSRLVGRITRPSRRVVLRAVAAAVASAWPTSLLARGQDPDAGRDSWQRVPDLLAAMQMREGAHVADVGAGGGFITRRLAAAAGPAGRVYAVEIDVRIAERLQQRMQDEGLTNVEVVRGSATDPGLPADRLDAVIVVDAYHEFTEHQAMLGAFRRALRRGGRLVICDNASRLPTRNEQAKWHGIATRLLEEEVTAAGFRKVFDRVVAASSVANVPIYGIDPRAQQASAVPSEAVTPHPATVAITKVRRPSDMPSGSLGALVRMTGGALADAADGPHQLVRDTRQYYRVVYRQPEAARGSRYQVRQVEVRARRTDVLVRTRERYVPR